MSNIPFAADETDVRILLESWFDRGCIVSCELKRDQGTLQHKGYGFVTLLDREKAEILVCLAKDDDHEFVLHDRPLRFEFSNHGSTYNRGSSSKSKENCKQIAGGVLSLGYLAGGNLHVLWDSQVAVKLEYDQSNQKFSFLFNDFLNYREYKLEFFYKYVFDMCSASTSRGSTGMLLQVGASTWSTSYLSFFFLPLSFYRLLLGIGISLALPLCSL